MESSTESSNWNGETNRQQGPLDAIIAGCLIEFIEGSLLTLVVRSSWITYVQSQREARRSLFDFLRKLSFMRKCFLGAGAVILFFNTIYVIQMLLPIYYDDVVCSITIRLTARTSYSVPIASVSLYLWTRQYLLHSSPILRAVIPKWFYILSKVSLLVTIVFFILPMIFMWYQGNWPLISFYKDGNCYLSTTASALTNAYTTTMTTLTVTAQTTYMLLFYQTLRMHQKINKSAANAQSNNRLQQHVRRCFGFTTVTVLTDCLTMVFVRFLPPTISIFRGLLVSKIDLMINMICMMFCFNTIPGFVTTVVKIITCRNYEMTEQKAGNNHSSNVRNTASTLAEDIENHASV